MELELTTETVHSVERKHREGQRMRVLCYGLFCDRTTHGALSYYIKALSRVWDGAILVREDLETSGGLGQDRPQAMEVMARLCETHAPVLPQHLGDIVRDITADPERHPRPRPGGAGRRPRSAPPLQAVSHGRRRGTPRRRRPPPCRPAAARRREGRVVYLDPRHGPGSGSGEAEVAEGPTDEGGRQGR
ncbi:MAG: hypothetical protein ACYC9Q_00805 [Bacillota bacterium]